MKKKAFAHLILTLSAFVSMTIVGNSQTCPPLTAGCLDYTFGNGGTSITYVPTTQNNLSPKKGAMQSDGKILFLADAHFNTGNGFTNVIIRYNADGSLDSSFGNSGIVYMNWNGADGTFGSPYGIAIQTVGTEERIIIAGTGTGGSSTLRVQRYLLDGNIDTSFGTNGTTFLNVGYADAVAVQPDGKILTFGWMGALVRLNVNGTPDTTFGSGGIVKTSVVKANALAVQSTGRILAAGHSTVGGKNTLTVARFNANGSYDDGSRSDSTPGDSFGTKGKTTISFYDGGTSGANAIKIDGNGKIVVAGNASRSGSPGDFAVARLTANGQLDTTFGVSGKATLDFSGFGDDVRSVELQSNGKIILTGITHSGTTSNTSNLGIARFNSNGTLDTTFGEGGKVVSNFSDTAESSYDGMIQIDPICGCEKIIAVGTAEIDGIDYAIAARYIP